MLTNQTVNRRTRTNHVSASIKKDRRKLRSSIKKKRTKKSIENNDNQEIMITQTKNNSNDFKLDIINTIEIKQEDQLINDCQLFDSLVDHNQFWHRNQIITSTDYYLPNSDMDNSHSPIHDGTSKSMNNNNGQSRKDKSLGLLCQR